MKSIIQIVWGYIVVFSASQPLGALIKYIFNLSTHSVSFLIFFIFLSFYQILPLEQSNCLIGFRIELRNQDFHQKV